MQGEDLLRIRDDKEGCPGTGVAWCGGWGEARRGGVTTVLSDGNRICFC